MSVWDIYEKRAEVRGITRRDTKLAREKRYLTTKLPDSLSYFEVTIDDIRQRVAIVNSDNLDEKTILSMPGEDIRHGGIVFWMDHYWIVTEKDANNEVYAKGKLLECNYLLKWIDDFGEIREQWCNVEDGTKLKRGYTRNGLVYWKQYAKRTPLIAGTPLEHYHQNRAANSCIWQWFENDNDWAISSQAPNRRRFNDYPGRGSRDKCSEMGSPKLRKQQGEDIVCALVKTKGAFNMPESLTNLYANVIQNDKQMKGGAQW